MTLRSGRTVWVPQSGWTPRVVAVDEDGTFLNERGCYDLDRFEDMWTRLSAFGVRFVVASGNQYWQIRDLFQNHANEIGYVSSNGAYVEDVGGEAVFAASADPVAVSAVIAESHRTPEVPLIMSGVRGAYVERGVSSAFVDSMGAYFHRIVIVDDLADVDDQVLMFSAQTDDATCRGWMGHFARACDEAMLAVYSGDGYFDLVVPGVSKASGLRALCERWGIAAGEVAAFGDSENDLEMLSWAGAGYAMANGDDIVRQAAPGLAPANTDDGVLQVLEAWFC